MYSWSGRSRQALPAASSHHQTLLGKALYEHGNCQRVAAVALSSSSIQNSSLGPNLLGLVRVDENTVPLFTSVFLLLNGYGNSSSSPITTLQFTSKLSMYIEVVETVPIYAALVNALLPKMTNNNNIGSKNRYFEKSLQEFEVSATYTLSRNASAIESIASSVLPSSISSSCIFPSLKTLIIRHVASEELVRNISTMFPVLEKLTLRVIPIMSTETLHGLSKLQNLTSLDLYDCAKIEDDGLEGIFCPALDNKNKHNDLTSLNLTGNGQISDIGLQSIANSAPNLTWLNLFECKEITDVGLKMICVNCPDLQTLMLEKCRKIADGTLVAISQNLANSLTSLNVACCKEITDSGLKALADIDKLTELDISHCQQITDAGIEALQTSSSSCRRRRKIFLTT